jgi:hypothetical protein
MGETQKVISKMCRYCTCTYAQIEPPSFFPLPRPYRHPPTLLNMALPPLRVKVGSEASVCSSIVTPYIPPDSRGACPVPFLLHLSH